MMQQKWMKIVSVISLTAMLATVATGCGNKNAETEVVDTGAPVETQIVVPRDFDKIVTMGGITASEATVPVIAMVSGAVQIEAINVKVGDKVKAGQVLAQLDSELSEINYSSAKLNYDNALRNYENNEPLHEVGAISDDTMAQLRMALKAAENQLNQAAIALNYSTVTAPISGTITSASGEVGGYASASQPMFVIDNLDQLEISTGINETNVNKIAVGQEVAIKINSLSDDWFVGHITEISRVMSQQTKNYPIKVSLENAGDELIAGMYAEMHVVVDHADDALVIPVQAIVYKDAQPLVFTAEADGTAKMHKVTFGINDGHEYVITDGLKAGDNIIVKGNSKLVDGDVVVVVNDAE